MNIPRVALSRAVDLLTLCTTLDRLLAIHCPLRWREWNKRRVAITIVVCASLLASATAALDVTGDRIFAGRLYTALITMTYRSVVFVATVTMTAVATVGFHRLSHIKRRRHQSTENRHARALMNAHQNHANNHLIPDAETNVNLNDEVEVDDASTFCRDKPHNGDVVTYINKDSSANLTIVGGIVRKSIP
jgi:hypothetical protein